MPLSSPKNFWKHFKNLNFPVLFTDITMTLYIQKFLEIRTFYQIFPEIRKNILKKASLKKSFPHKHCMPLEVYGLLVFILFWRKMKGKSCGSQYSPEQYVTGKTMTYQAHIIAHKQKNLSWNLNVTYKHSICYKVIIISFMCKRF